MTPKSRSRKFRLTLVAATLALVAVALLPAYLSSRQRPLRMLKAWALESDLLADDGVMFQSNAANCGHVALMMVLRRLGHAIPIPLIDLAGGARWGLSAADLARESREAGLSASVLEIDDVCLERALAKLPMPAVALLGTHFVVIERRPESGVVGIIDPSLGRLRMPLGVVQREWRDVLIAFGELPAEIRPALCG